ncbi:MAG TPA: hypothetical protein VGO66_03225 [Solirubrobacterales bacterium]|jgi:hypothetical protein|nr:hypothetical protein [Solirubrobacterales bacterium]
MDDLGQPSSYRALAKGAAVYSSDGKELGKVTKVLADPNSDLFDGVIFDTTPMMPGGHRFVDAPEVAAIYDRGLVLSIDAAAAEGLPEPSANPGSLSVKPGDLGKGSRGALGRAWDRLSGKG